MTATNMCSNFVGFRCGPPFKLNHFDALPPKYGGPVQALECISTCRRVKHMKSIVGFLPCACSILQLLYRNRETI